METPTAKPVEIFVDTRGARIIDEEGAWEQRDSRDIYLPNHVESVSHIAVDIGGSLAKVVYFTRSLGGSSGSSNASPVIPSQALEPEMFHDRLAELQASGHRGGNGGAAGGSSTDPSTSSRSLSFSSSHSRESSMSHRELNSPTSSLHSSAVLAASPSSASFDACRKGRSGTLTPTAILRSTRGSSDVAVSSNYISAMHSSFLKRRSLPSALPGGRLNFIRFETGHIEECIEFLAELIDRSAQSHGVSKEQMRKGVKVMATGGGAHMFYDQFEKQLGVEVRREDEMACLITGLNFITLIPDEVFWYSDELVSALNNNVEMPVAEPNAPPAAPTPEAESQQAPPTPSSPPPLPRPSPYPPNYAPEFDSNPSPKLPCLLVNIGSGVSIIKVDDYGKFERVSGTSLGGGTLWGLLSLLTDAESFDEMLAMSEQGDNASVDMLVGDIYGSVGYNALGLKSSTIASSFGKVFRKDGSRKEGAEGRKRRFRPEDICRSLLYAISNNIGQIAYMNAEKYDLDRIYFGGCFIRGHKATISTLSYAIRFWSKGTKRALFLRHEGFLGAIGAWIKHISLAEGPPNMALPPALSANGEAAPQPLPTVGVTAVTDTTRANLIRSPPVPVAAGPTPSPMEFEGSSLEGQNLPAFLAEALGPPQQPQVNGKSQGISVPPTLSRIPSEREVRDAIPAGGTATGSAEAQEVDKAEQEVGEVNLLDDTGSLDEMISSLSESERTLLAPVLRELDTLRGRTNGGETKGEDGARTELDAANVAELLAKMEAADVAADGLEDKLDRLLDKLDSMLDVDALTSNATALDSAQASR